MAITLKDFEAHLQKNRELFRERMEEEKERERETLKKGLVLLINT